MSDEAQTYLPIEARRLAVGDHFVPDRSKDDAIEHGWYWRVVEHCFTGRGDYSTVVADDDGTTTWTERFEPDERVWLVEPKAEQTGADR